VVAVTASPYDTPLSAIHDHADDLGGFLAIWQARLAGEVS
jgi:hypothetical protein